MTLAQINALSLADFVDAFGEIYEHAPWVAEAAGPRRPFHRRDELQRRMRVEVEFAGRDRQLALLRAHPDLGTRAKIGELSTREQRGAGLDQLTPDEHEVLLVFNDRYREKFGFPFIYAVRGSDKHDIQTALMVRLESDPEEEFAQAMWEVHRIAAFRLADLVEPQ
jgi:OHCU decarboxylase